MTITIVVGNFKGGVGKTKVSVMASWELAFAREKKFLFLIWTRKVTQIN